jgi:hypothetical protein
MDDDDKKLLFKVLKQAGITKATIDFDGGGDSGQIDQITVEGLLEGVKLRDVPIPPDGAPLVEELPDIMGNKPNTMYELIESAGYDILEHDSPCDWINNDGGSGYIIFEPEKESIFFEMNERVKGVELHQMELGFYNEPEAGVTPEVTNG